MVYGYHRTSTKEQHLDRGINEITQYCKEHNMKLEKVYTDQQTGKNFDRARYIVLTEDVLRAGDILIITEIDRLGRTKQDTLDELRKLSNTSTPIDTSNTTTTTVTSGIKGYRYLYDNNKDTVITSQNGTEVTSDNIPYGNEGGYLHVACRI